MTTASLEIASGSDPLLRIGPFVAGVIVVALLIGAFWPGARIRGREPDPRRPVPRNSRGFPRAARSPRSWRTANPRRSRGTVAVRPPTGWRHTAVPARVRAPRHGAVAGTARWAGAGRAAPGRR